MTQVAYFDFWGASFGVHYPWKGDMRDFLSYTAKWEQAIALRLKNRYDVIWFPARLKQGTWDIYGGLLDGLNLRANLDTDGEPILYESIHNSVATTKPIPPIACKHVMRSPMQSRR